MTGEEYRKIRETITNEDLEKGKVKILLYSWGELVLKYGMEKGSRFKCLDHPIYFLNRGLHTKISNKAEVTGLPENSVAFPPFNATRIPPEFIQSIIVDGVYSVPPKLQKVVDYV
jgi:hypothetical protein